MKKISFASLILTTLSSALFTGKNPVFTGIVSANLSASLVLTPSRQRSIKRILIVGMTFMVSLGHYALAQTETVGKNTCYPVTMHTMNDNFIKGILVGANDSMVYVFPGTVKQWKKGENFKTASFGYGNIKNIKLKKRRSVMRGMLIGAGIGMVPAIASGITGNSGTKGSYAIVSVVTVPLGMISGGVTGMSSGKKFNVAGDRERFQQFLFEIK